MAEERAGWTYADYIAFPDDGMRHELLDGVLVREPAPRLSHQGIIRELFLELSRHLDEEALHGLFLSPVGVILSDTTILQPDLVYASPDRPGRLRDEGIFGPPDLVIEVLSPSTRTRDLQEKKQLYARHEVPEYWVVDPSGREIIVFTQPTLGSYCEVHTHLPGDTAMSPTTGWTVDVRRVFERARL